MDFYRINEGYNKFLQRYEKEKFFDKKQEGNILIRVPGDEKEVKGSLRFNYMLAESLI